MVAMSIATENFEILGNVFLLIPACRLQITMFLLFFVCILFPQLYADIVLLLSDHQQLVEDFAGFLLSFQALECQCFTSSHQINQIRRFLRQIEVNFMVLSTCLNLHHKLFYFLIKGVNKYLLLCRFIHCN